MTSRRQIIDAALWLLSWNGRFLPDKMAVVCMARTYLYELVELIAYGMCCAFVFSQAIGGYLHDD
jgi:hypothetical protein